MPKRKNNEINGTPPKKSFQSFRTSYTNEWNFLKPSQKGFCYVHCTICKSDFSCQHGQRHVNGKHHKENEQIVKHTRTLDVFRSTYTEKDQDDAVSKTTRAEDILIWIARMNWSLVNIIVPAFKPMFPDSKIAKEMTCGRNKATAYIKELAGLQKDTLTVRMRKWPFTMSTDGSTDEKSKQHPLVVRSLDVSSGNVNSELLSVPICEGSAKGEKIFNLIDDEMTKRHIPWENCISFGTDNANVMIGRHKDII